MGGSVIDTQTILQYRSTIVLPVCPNDCLLMCSVYPHNSPYETAMPHTPKSLKNDGDSLVILWQDDREDRLSWKLLRERCPCATCLSERNNPPTPEPTSALPILSMQEAQPLKPTSMEAMGNYAYSINFNDGHNTGIYSLELLRELGEEQSSS